MEVAAVTAPTLRRSEATSRQHQVARPLWSQQGWQTYAEIFINPVFLPRLASFLTFVAPTLDPDLLSTRTLPSQHSIPPRPAALCERNSTRSEPVSESA